MAFRAHYERDAVPALAQAFEGSTSTRAWTWHPETESQN